MGRTRFSAPAQTGPGAHPASCIMGTGSFPGVKNGRGVTLTPHPLPLPWSRKSRAIRHTSTLPMGRTACTEPQCLYSRAIPLLPSVPVQYSYTSTPLSACTVQLYLYSPQCLYNTAIPLLPLWAVRPVKSLSACTMVHFNFTLDS